MKNKQFNVISKSCLWAVVLLFSVSAQSDEGCFRVGVHCPKSVDIFINKFRGAIMLSEEVPRVAQGNPIEMPCIGTKTGDTIDHVWYKIPGLPLANSLGDTTYVLRWDGEGELQMGSSSDSGYLEYNIADQMDRTVRLGRIKLIRSNKDNPVRNVRLYLKSYEHMYEKEGKVFQPEFLELIEPFKIIRFMGVFKTNNSKFRSWQDHTPKDYQNQRGGPHDAGLAYEWAAELCNVAGKHMWFNVPHQADDYSIRKMAQIVRDNLDPNLNVFLEYSNETWNWGRAFKDQTIYVEEHGGVVDGHVALSMNVFRIWYEEFGDQRHRVLRVMPDANSGRGIHRIKACGPENFDVYAPTYYWAGGKDGWNENTTVEQMLDDIRDNIRHGKWYRKLKERAEQGKLYGVDVYCYEGGLGGDPEPVKEYPYWKSFLKLQKDKRLLPIIRELVDTMAVLGFKGGNELSLFAGWEGFEPKSPSSEVSFWGMITSHYSDPDQYPKYAGMRDAARKYHDCDNLDRDNDTVGAGLALLFDGLDDRVNLSSIFKPLDGSEIYTFEFWLYPMRSAVEQTLLYIGDESGRKRNCLYLSSTNRITWSIGGNGADDAETVSGPILATGRHYHIAAVKEAEGYRLFVNGVEKISVSGAASIGGETAIALLGAGRVNGAYENHFRGKMDELRIWEASLTREEIQSWMCRKIDNDHPGYSALRNAYRFDHINNTTVADVTTNAPGVLQNFNFSLYSHYVTSGAPIGDDARYVYPPQWNDVSLSIAHPNGDRVYVSELGSGNPEGVQIYRVDVPPNSRGMPTADYTRLGNYYYGIFPTSGAAASYTVRYRYAGCPEADAGAGNRLMRRRNNTEFEWQSTGAELDMVNKELFTRPGLEAGHNEYILGVREVSAAINRGPGYALRFPGDSCEARGIPFIRPDTAYTVSLWFKGHGSLVRFTDYNEGSAARNTQLSTFADKSIKFEISGSPGVGDNGDYLIDPEQWNHIAFVKDNNTVSLYLNGSLHPSIRNIPLGQNVDATYKDVEYIKMMVGENFSGLIDEIRIWDIALSEQRVREWMCRTLTDKHPEQDRHLVAYFPFDEGRGRTAANRRGTDELRLVGDIEWEYSGAPLGDTSAYRYSTGKLTLNCSLGDRLSVTADSAFSEDYLGHHIYRLDRAPLNSRYPSSVDVVDTTHYWGVWVVPNSKHTNIEPYRYTINYEFGSYPAVSSTDGLTFVTRPNNATTTWNTQVTGSTSESLKLTIETKKECAGGEKYCSAPRELMVAAAGGSNLSPDIGVPLQPGAISGPAVVCAGATGLIYRIAPVAKAENYHWVLPEGMVGYSSADSIVVSIARDADDQLGEVSVAAVNKYGRSQSRNMAVAAEKTVADVTIEGPSEVCWGATGVSYRIPNVPGISSFEWVAGGDAKVTGSSTVAILDAGAGNTVLSVYGSSSCGKTLLASKAVTVYQSPQLDLPVEGGRVCRGCDGCAQYARVTVSNSETGIVYQAYKRNGTAPIGGMIPGNGGDAVLFLPLDELLVGENLISVKAGAGNCPSIEMTQRASVVVDITPPTDLEISFHKEPVCPGDSAVFLIKGAPPGIMFKVFGDYDMTVDMPFLPWSIEEPTFSTGGETYITVPPASGHSQMCGEGVAIGYNEIWFTAQIGSCPTMMMDTRFAFDLDWGKLRYVKTRHDYHFWLKRYDPIPFDSSNTIWTSLSSDEVCERDSFTFTIHNAQKGVGYTAVQVGRHSGMRAYPLQYLSDTVYCSTEGENLDLRIRAGHFEANSSDAQSIGALAFGENIGSPCSIILWDHQNVTIYPSPDTSLPVGDMTVCKDGDARITVHNSEDGITYRARIVGSEYWSGRKTGDGDDLVFTLPGQEFERGTNKVVIEASSDYCTDVVLQDTATVTRVDNLDVGLTVTGNYSDLCIGVDAEVIVHNPEVGVEYSAFRDSRRMSDWETAQSDSLVLKIPAEDIENLVGTPFVITVHARAGDCTGELTNVVGFNILSMKYPEGTIQVHRPGKKGTTFCPEDEFLWISEVAFDDGNPYPLYIQGTLNGKLIGRPVLVDTTHQNPREKNIAIPFPRDELPVGDTVVLGFAALIEGCPPKKIDDFKCWHCDFTGDRQPVWIAEGYDLGVDVLPDTICAGGNGTVIVVLPQDEETRGFDYRLYDPETDTEICPAAMARDLTVRRNGGLPLSPFDPGVLNPGENVFDVQVRHREGGDCGWQSLDNKAVIVVRESPDRTLSVTGNSVCAGDGTVMVERTEVGVRYQAFVGNTGVTEEKDGTGDSLVFEIPSKWLNKGSNEISIRATASGCGTVVLQQSAIVQVIDHAPARPQRPTGPAEVCAYATQVKYSVPFDQEALTYTWHLPPGASTNSTTNVALIDFGVAGGEISVTANSACGAGEKSEPLVVTTRSSGAGGIIAGQNKAECEGMITMTLSGYDGRILNWQWSEKTGEWNDIYETSSTVTVPTGRSDRTFRAVIDNGGCGRVVSRMHVVQVDACSVSPLQIPIPVPDGGTMTNRQFTVRFQPSYQDNVRDIYYTFCPDPYNCPMEDVVRYNPSVGIEIDLGPDNYSRLAYQARPKPGKEEEYLPSPTDTALYVFGLNQLGVPVPRPKGGVFKRENVVVHFEEIEQSAFREIRYRVCDDTLDCDPTNADYLIYDPEKGISLDLSDGKKGLVFQAVPLPAYENKYSAGEFGRELYRYLPGIVVSMACYKDRDADGRIDYAEITFDSLVSQLPQQVELRAPHNPGQKVTKAPVGLSAETIAVDFSNEEFTPVHTGFDPGLYGTMHDSSGVFNTGDFEICDSVAPVVVSALYIVAGTEDAGYYRDSLVVTFSESVLQEGAHPFIYENLEQPFVLESIHVEETVLRAIVSVPSNRTGQAVPPDATLRINVGETENRVRDQFGNYQRNPHNRAVPITVKADSRPITKKYGPTLFRASEREFVMVLRPHDRVGMLSADSEASAKIFDRTGNVVAVKKFDRTSEDLRMRWDGRNRNGRYVGQGTYILVLEYRLNGENGSERIKIGVKR